MRVNILNKLKASFPKFETIDQRVFEDCCEHQANAIMAFIEDSKARVVIAIPHQNRIKEMSYIAHLLNKKGCSTGLIVGSNRRAGFLSMQEGKHRVYLGSLQMMQTGWRVNTPGTNIMCLMSVGDNTKEQLAMRLSNPDRNVWANGQYFFKNGSRV